MGPKKTEAVPLPRFGRVRTNLKMGIVGLPNVGKSSLFNLMGDNASAAAENFAFCTIDPNETRCSVKDERFEYLANLWTPPSRIPAFLNLVDIAGLIKGASEGAGLGNAFLSHIQAVDGIYHMVRAFDNLDVLHVEESVDPARDLEVITGELCAKDITYLEKQNALCLAELKKDPKKKLPDVFYTVMERCNDLLRSNTPIRTAEWSAEEIHKINEVLPQLITTKPMVYLLNISKRDWERGGNKYLVKIKEWIDAHGGGMAIPFSVEYEEELKRAKEAGDDAAVQALIDSTKGRGSCMDKIITSGYKALKLQYFFTAGDKEVRAWTCMEGSTAPQAAGCIHSDFERGFIKAETAAFDDFKALHQGKKSMADVKAAGKYRQEGKQYIVKDGDIIFFQFNVTNDKKK